MQTMESQVEEQIPDPAAPPPPDEEIVALERDNLVREAPVTVLRVYELIILNLLIFGLSSSRPEIIDWGAVSRIAVLEGHEYYRMISAMFLHFDIVHLFLNMLVLFVVGRVVEGYYGHARFLLIYLIGGLCGSVASILFNMPIIYSVGASGAIYALFSAQLILQIKYRKAVDFGRAGRNSLLTIALNLIYGFDTPGVDNWGHLGGLFGGLFVALICTRLFSFVKPYEDRSRLFSLETHPRATRAMVVAALTTTTILASTLVPFLLPRTLTVGDITMTVPAGWRTITDFEYIEYCGQRGVQCLLTGAIAEGTWFEVARFSSPYIELSTLEAFDTEFAEELEANGTVLVSRHTTQIDGHEAVVRICDLGNTREMYVLIWDYGKLIKFDAASPASTFENYRQGMESIATSMKFQAK